MTRFRLEKNGRCLFVNEHIIHRNGQTAKIAWATKRNRQIEKVHFHFPPPPPISKMSRGKFFTFPQMHSGCELYMISLSCFQMDFEVRKTYAWRSIFSFLHLNFVEFSILWEKSSAAYWNNKNIFPCGFLLENHKTHHLKLFGFAKCPIDSKSHKQEWLKKSRYNHSGKNNQYLVASVRTALETRPQKLQRPFRKKPSI